MTNNKYRKTLDFLFEKLPMYQRTGAAAFKKDLGNTIALCETLGNPQLKFPSIHIAGTNGKGSTANMLSAILQAGGLKVGLYTSPHYQDFRERIRINGIPVSEEFVIDFTHKHKEFIEKLQPSFFEITVAMAFQAFAEEEVDIAVVETGLGGRLDSTNIIQPLLSLITNISYDHQDLLGESLQEIAFEKAGIIKAKTPVIISESQEEVKSVFTKKASENQAEIFFAEDFFSVNLIKSGYDASSFKIVSRGAILFENLEVGLFGNYQSKNIGGTLMAVHILIQLGLKITDSNIREGLKNLRKLTGFRGRWQKLGESPLILCDSGHNESGWALLIQQLSQIPAKKLHFVLGMVKEKDPVKLLALVPKSAQYYFCSPDIPRGMPVQQLFSAAQNQGLSGKAYSSVGEALAEAKKEAGISDLIFIGGSSFVVAEVV